MHNSKYKILQLDEVDSTNDFSKKLILQEDIQDNHIIIADHQTHGKGRLGRVWESPSGMGIWMSLILKPDARNNDLVLYNFMTSITVCETLREVTLLPLELKWPNDILIKGKKVCGILLETVNKNTEQFLVVGIGININQQDFPEPLDKIATSLFIETRTVWDRSIILQKLLANLGKNYVDLDPGIFLRWKSLSRMLGSKITVVQGNDTYDATAKDIAEDGALVVEKNGKIEKLYAGDVHIQWS